MQAGQIGQGHGRARARRTWPHSAWFWDAPQAGGGAIVDLGCHCIEIIRSYMGKENRPVEVFCWPTRSSTRSRPRTTPSR